MLQRLGEKKLHMIALGGLFLVTIHTLLTTMFPKLNLIDYLISKNKIFQYIVVIVIFFMLYTLIKRDTFLPFLGDCAFPCSSNLFKNAYPKNSNEMIIIKTPYRNAKIIYWASQEDEDEIKETPWEAYGQMENTGITTTDQEGNATLKFAKPTRYKIPSGKVLKRHVHYRVCKKNYMLGRVETIYV